MRRNDKPYGALRQTARSGLSDWIASERTRTDSRLPCGLESIHYHNGNRAARSCDPERRDVHALASQSIQTRHCRSNTERYKSRHHPADVPNSPPDERQAQLQGFGRKVRCRGAESSAGRHRLRLRHQIAATVPPNSWSRKGTASLGQRMSLVRSVSQRFGRGEEYTTSAFHHHRNHRAEDHAPDQDQFRPHISPRLSPTMPRLRSVR